MFAMEHEMINVSQHNAVYLFETSIRYRANHFHFEQELFLVLSGDITVIVSGKLYNLHKGDIALFGKNQSHMLSAESDNLLLVAQFNLGLLNIWFPQIEVFQQLNAIIPCDPQGALWRILERNLLVIAAHQAESHPYSQLVSLNALMTVVLAMVRHFNPSEGPAPRSYIPELTDPRQKRILHWINDHYRQNITLQQLAAQEGINTCYLSHFIRENLGFTFTQFVTELRTSHAAHLLESTDMTILDILLDSGFSDYRYMRKAFQERFHCTPKEYRNASKSHTLPQTEQENKLVMPTEPQFSQSLSEYVGGFPNVFLVD